MKTLPYRATSSSGDMFDIEFPLHRDTGDAVRISHMISELLQSIDRSLSIVTCLEITGPA